MFLMILWSIVFIRMITVSPWGGWMYRIKLMMTLWTGYGNREGRDIKHGITAGKTYPKVAARTWPYDGVQALCLMDSLLRHGKFSLKAYSDALLAWYEEGFWAVDGTVFDVGIQTADALGAYKKGIPAKDCGLINPEGRGTGYVVDCLRSAFMILE